MGRQGGIHEMPLYCVLWSCTREERWEKREERDGRREKREEQGEERKREQRKEKREGGNTSRVSVPKNGVLNFQCNKLFNKSFSINNSVPRRS